MIPEKHLNFCRAVGKLAKEHGLFHFTGIFTPGFNDEWHDRIEFNWDSGRHQSDVDKISISSTVQINTKLEVKP